MLRLRLSVDLKCRSHPWRQHPMPTTGMLSVSRHRSRDGRFHLTKADTTCALCIGLSPLAESTQKLERQIIAETRVGAEVRWKNFRRRRVL